MSTEQELRERDQEIDRQVSDMLAKSAGYRAMSIDDREQVRRNTTAIVGTMVENRLAQTAGGPGERFADPYAVPFEGPPVPGTMPGTMPGMMPGMPGAGGMMPGGAGPQRPTFTGGAQPGSSMKFGPQSQGDFGSAIATGVSMAGELLRQVNFPAFVAELIQGVFQAVVDASIQQMKAYGELVQGVAMSLNDFRDANVTENQGRDHLVSKFPQLMQINVTGNGPRVGLRPDADTDDLPDIGSSLGMSQTIGDLDDDLIESQLVPAARNDLARSRQSLLATMLLMGINRIIITDGRINAKLMFDFKARDTFEKHAQSYDYQNFGVSKASQSQTESSEETGTGFAETRGGVWTGGSRSGESNRWSKGTYQYTETPAIYLTAINDQVTSGELEAKAKLSGEVSLNFRSETFDLNKLASADEIFRLERVREGGAGRGAPPAGQPGAAGPPGAGGQPAGTPGQTGNGQRAGGGTTGGTGTGTGGGGGQTTTPQPQPQPQP